MSPPGRCLSVAVVTAQPLAALPPYGCGVPFTGGERHWQLQVPVYSANRTGSRNCHCEEAAGRRGNLGKAVAILPMASQLSGRVLRDCHVASLLAMTRQESARCTSALARLNCPPRGAQGTPLHFPSGPFRVFCAKKYRKHRLPVISACQKSPFGLFRQAAFRIAK